MKQVQVLAFCENHPDVDAVEEVTASFAHGKARTVDVCAQCRRDIVEPFAELLAKGTPEGHDPAAFGKSSATPKKERRHECPLCDHKSPTRGALGQHLRQHHDTNFTTLAEAGTPVPLPTP